MVDRLQNYEDNFTICKDVKTNAVDINCILHFFWKDR